MGLLGLAVTALRRTILVFPGFAFGVVWAAALLVGFSWHFPGGVPLGLGFVGLQGVLGGALAVLLFGRGRGRGLVRRGVAVVVLGLSAWGDYKIYDFLAQPGSDAHLALVPEAVGMPGAGQLAMSNPAEPGGYRVREVTYGSGGDGGRWEYGRGAVLPSRRVDGRGLLGEAGWSEGELATLERLWGFGLGEVPLNGRVWFPDAAGAFPVVVIVHGNHTPDVASEDGYGYLGEGLASRGYVVVTVDENFLNSPALAGRRGEPAARGWLVLEHLRQWREWNGTAGHLMAGRLDLGRVALVGHSRGGEAVVTAALFNRLSQYPEDAHVRFEYGFGIQAVVALAPVDGQYAPVGRRKHLTDVSYLVVQGARDLQQPVFVGDAQYARTSFSDGQYRFKAEVYVDRANHSQFSTVWGRGDYPGFSRWMVNAKAVMSGEEQRRLARVWVGAFLEATLKGRREYVRLFRDPRAAWHWLPDAAYVTRFEDATFRLVAGFEEDAELNTTSLGNGRAEGDGLRVWREQPVQVGGTGEDRNTAVCLGWNVPGGAYSLRLPPERAARWLLGTNDSLQLAAAVLMGEKPGSARSGAGGRWGHAGVDLTVELVDAHGVAARLPLSRQGPLRIAARKQLLKWDYLDRKFAGREPDPVLRTYCLPLAAFVAEAPRLDLARLEVVRFRFDRCRLGLILLDDVGFAARL
jgi:dienelactone hydrolase